jgi:hypothetical protein
MTRAPRRSILHGNCDLEHDMTQEPVTQQFFTLARAFTVHFGPTTNLAAGICTGRAEHVATGVGVNFESVEALMKFFSDSMAPNERGTQRIRFASS